MSFFAFRSSLPFTFLITRAPPGILSLCPGLAPYASCETPL